MRVKTRTQVFPGGKYRLKLGLDLALSYFERCESEIPAPKYMRGSIRLQLRLGIIGLSPGNFERCESENPHPSIPGGQVGLS